MHLTNDEPGYGVELFAGARRTPPLVAMLAVTAILLAVFQVDRGTGTAPVQHFYYLAIVLAGARFGFRGGIVSAVAATALYHAANPRLLEFVYGEGDIVQVTLFLGVGIVAGKIATDAVRVHQLAMTDDLTGLHNLRSFEREFAKMVLTAGTERSPLSLLALDVDRLKSINDEHGHLTGSDAVRTIGRLMAAWAPPSAVACRYGGDEFVVALPVCPKVEAVALADDLRRVINGASVVLAGTPFPPGSLSVSVGVSTIDSNEWTASAATAHDASALDAGERLFRTADQALYEAKASGRNRTATA